MDNVGKDGPFMATNTFETRRANAPEQRARQPDTVVEPGQFAPLLERAFFGSPHPQILIAPVADRILAANAAAQALTEGQIDNGPGQRVSSVYRDTLEQLHLATQEALYRGFAYSRRLRPAGLDPDTYPDGALEHRLTACGSGLAKGPDGPDGFLLVEIVDLEALSRRTRDTEVNALHRAGLDEWKKAEQFLREVEQRNQLILTAAGEGIYGVDADGVTTFVNPAAERMLGWRADELIGLEMHRMVHFKHLDGSHYAVHDCPIYNAFRRKTVTTIDDEYFWRKDGRPIQVEYTSTPIIEDGRSIGAVVVFRDVTERKRNEEKLRRALDENAVLRERLEAENAYLQEEILSQSNHHEFLGNSEATKRTIRQIDVVAPTDANVLITGESGTGKELVAGAIHHASPRRDRPLIRVNCAAIPRELFESEFFGHVKGAFSGAFRDRTGRFELANGGTLFLDEVGEIPLDLQSKLLRVLQEGRFERVGEEHTREVDVRIIAATNRDLEAEVAAGRFREDLYFRLNVFPIACQPLRDRRDDIPILAQHFLKVSCRRMNIPEPRLSKANVESLMRYDWPGNARELQNVIERAAILSRKGRLVLNPPAEVQSNPRPKPSNETSADGTKRIMTAAEMAQFEADNIRAALEAAGGRVSGAGGAAELLGIKPPTLYSRLRKLRVTGAGI